MSIQRFLTYIQYSTKRPFIARVEGRYYISVPRWNAMISWARKNNDSQRENHKL